MSGLQLSGGPEAPLVSRETATILGGARIGLHPNTAHSVPSAWPEQILPARLLGTSATCWQEFWQCQPPCRAGQQNNLTWQRSGDILYGVIHLDEAEFAHSESPPLQAATESAYRQIFALLAAEQLPELWRVWNYFAAINTQTHGLERYRQFNSGRQAAFLACQAALSGKVPAACALGLTQGPLSIAFMAGNTPGVAIENPRQVSAYFYPTAYGPKSPTFSRAMLARPPGQEILFISGTASILGHQTVHTGDVAAQTAESLNNILAVLAEANRQAHSAPFQAQELCYRAYVRRGTEQPLVARVLASILGRADICYIEADVCRSDLLVEIEATGIHQT
ncbi:hypothetical protein [Azonexus sp.]|uniref:chorismate transformation enzyme, FkbO/Hyg5 family n=1 Tax=Azonexus sp. TaxID=1872668 RepID=UPI0039E6CE13